MSNTVTYSTLFGSILARCPGLLKTYVGELVDIYNKIATPSATITAELFKHHDPTILDEDATTYAQNALNEVIFIRQSLLYLIEPYPEVFEGPWNEKKIQDEILAWMPDQQKDVILAAEITAVIFRRIRVIVDRSRTYMEWEPYLENVIKISVYLIQHSIR